MLLLGLVIFYLIFYLLGNLPKRNAKAPSFASRLKR